jgi:hypothetical protein
MRAATTTPFPRLKPAARETRPRYRGARLLGLAIASLAPGIFWSVLIASIAAWLGAPLKPLTVAMTCAAISSFLAIVCAPFILRDPAHHAVNTRAGTPAKRHPSRTEALGIDAA